jgi:hypothetical protein
MTTANLFSGEVDYCASCRGDAELECYNETNHVVFKEVVYDEDPINYEKLLPPEKIPQQFSVNTILDHLMELEDECISPKTVLYSYAGGAEVDAEADKYAASTPAPAPAQISLEPCEYLNKIWDPEIDNINEWLYHGLDKGSIDPSHLSYVGLPSYMADAEILEPAPQPAGQSPPAFLEDDWFVNDWCVRLKDIDDQYAGVPYPSECYDDSDAKYPTPPPMAWGAAEAEHMESLKQSSMGFAQARHAAAAEELNYVNSTIITCLDDFDSKVQELQNELQAMTANYESRMRFLKSRKFHLEDQLGVLSVACSEIQRKRRNEERRVKNYRGRSFLLDDGNGETVVDGSAKRICLR